jgi:hypothetical protein
MTPASSEQIHWHARVFSKPLLRFSTDATKDAIGPLSFSHKINQVINQITNSTASHHEIDPEVR